MCIFSHMRHAGALISLAAAALAPAFPATAATQVTLFVFPESGKSGYYPQGTLFRDATGSLYGTSFVGGNGKGNVFRLKPPAPGQTNWTFSVLCAFRGGDDGGSPSGGVVMDRSGALYGTASADGHDSNGVVFKLTPPGPGQTAWMETVLHSFRYNVVGEHDGARPQAGLIMDASGALYGTTDLGGTPDRSGVGFGTVFKLTPPGPGNTGWTEAVLYRFGGGADGQTPLSALTADGRGALYGITHYGGTGACQDLRGDNVGCGTVFKLTPPGAGSTGWTKTTLYKFTGGHDGGLPEGTLRVDASGAVYGTAYQGGTGQCFDGLPSTVIGCGTVFKLTPPASGQAAWTESVIHDFNGTDGAAPQGGVIADATGRLYGTGAGGGSGGFGVAFRLVPPPAGQARWTQTVLHNFDILTSGQDPGSGLVSDAQGHLFGVATHGGAGLGGTVYEVLP
jgi:uncharacterized protein YceK